MATTDTTVDIANGAALSNAADVRGMRIVGIIIPTAWTAAAITFQAADQAASDNDYTFVDGDPNSFYDVYTEANVEVTIASAGVPTSGGRYIYLNGATVGSAQGLSFEYVKVRSGTTGSPVNQGAARKVTLVLERTR